jgi:hypothetical protein
MDEPGIRAATAADVPAIADLDPDGLATDLLLQAAIDPITAPELRIDRVLHLGSRDPSLAGAGGQLVGLLQQIDDLAQPGGEPVRIADEPRGLLDGTRHRAAIERKELFTAHHPGDEARIEQGGFRRALDAVVEVGGDLEQLFEIVVERAQQVNMPRSTMPICGGPWR